MLTSLEDETRGKISREKIILEIIPQKRLGNAYPREAKALASLTLVCIWTEFKSPSCFPLFLSSVFVFWFLQVIFLSPECFILSFTFCTSGQTLIQKILLLCLQEIYICRGGGFILSKRGYRQIAWDHIHRKKIKDKELLDMR